MARPQAGTFGAESPVVAVGGDRTDEGMTKSEAVGSLWLHRSEWTLDLLLHPKGTFAACFCRTTLSVFGPAVILSLGCALCSKFSVRVDRRICAFEANRLLSFGVIAPIANAFTEQLTLLKRFTLLKMSNCWTERQ